MRLLMTILALWLAPLGLGNDADDDGGLRARPRPTCPGGKCKVTRPRPRPSR